MPGWLSRVMTAKLKLEPIYESDEDSDDEQERVSVTRKHSASHSHSSGSTSTRSASHGSESPTKDIHAALHAPHFSKLLRTISDSDLIRDEEAKKATNHRKKKHEQEQQGLSPHVTRGKHLEDGFGCTNCAHLYRQLQTTLDDFEYLRELAVKEKSHDAEQAMRLYEMEQRIGIYEQNLQNAKGIIARQEEIIRKLTMQIGHTQRTSQSTGSTTYSYNESISSNSTD